MYGHLHSLSPPPTSRGKGSLTARSSLSDCGPTPQSSSFSLRTAVDDADEPNVASLVKPRLSGEMTARALAQHPHQQRSASGETAVEDLVHLGDLSAAELGRVDSPSEQGRSYDASASRSDRFSSFDDGDDGASSGTPSRPSSARTETPTGDASSNAGHARDRLRSDRGSQSHSQGRSPATTPGPSRRPSHELGMAVKPPPNGMPIVSDNDCSQLSEASPLREAFSEMGFDSGDDNEAANGDDDGNGPSRRKSFSATTPKLGGFGVRNDHVPHVEGMTSAATDRAKRYEDDAVARRNRQRSKSDSRGSQADNRRCSARHSSSNLVGKRREQLPEAREWGENFWCVITDPKTQASFFANPQTGECRWEVPAGTIVLPPNPDGEWWELYDEERGLPYYYHTQTAKSAWVRPKGFVIPLTAIQESTLGRRFSRQEFGEEQISARASLVLTSDSDLPSAALTGMASSTSLPASHASARGAKARAQPPPPAHSPGIEQVLAGKARRRIMGADRALVAQALAQQPLFRSAEAGMQRSYSADGNDAPAANGRPRNMRVAFDGRTHGKMRSDAARAGTGGLIARQKSSMSMSSGSTGERNTAPRLRCETSSRSMRASASEPHGLIPSGAGLAGSRSISTLSGSTTRSAVRRTIRRERDPVKRLSPIESLRSKRSEPPAPEIKRLSTGDHLCMSSALQTEIRMLAFETYAQRKFTTHRTGPFRRKVTVDKLARWQKGPINAPLLHLDFKELQRDAVKIFKVVQRIMGDRDSSVHAKPPAPLKLTYGIKLVEENSGSSPMSPRMPTTTTNGLPLLSPTLPDCLSAARNGKLPRPCDSSSPDPDDMATSAFPSLSLPASSRAPSILEEERWVLERGMQSLPLRDEIYAQLIKQLTGNPSGSSIFRGWQFLCVVLVTFPPSGDLRDYLHNFIDEHQNDADEAIAIMAQHCAGRLSLICRRGARKSTPSVAEIQSASDAAFNPGVFGRTLETIMETQRDAYPHIQVPIVLVFLCNALLAVDALRTEGVFRVAGDAELVTELKVRIERGHYRLDGVVGIGGSDGDVAVLASELKQWLRELEEPLIPTSLYERCLQMAEQPSQCIDLVRTLPTPARRTLLYLVSFLQLFTQPWVVRQTKMPAESLALIFAPTLLRKEPERLSVLFNNTKYEQHFVLCLLRHLPCAEVDKDFVPVHATATEAGVPGSTAGAPSGTVAGGTAAQQPPQQPPPPQQQVNAVPIGSGGASRRQGHRRSQSGSTATELSLHVSTDEGWSSERSIFDAPVRLKPHTFGGAVRGNGAVVRAQRREERLDAGAPSGRGQARTDEATTATTQQPSSYQALRHRPGTQLETVTDVSQDASSDE
ncbi:uncharacterized protein PFL1_05113 [Pseudozyma flocculosa PF-1]|nr:uncharacterized protein PFL1_05113 [Pseudozyma flocculosa PF-1]EPQ27190.1 hypothetical protein PFL1_05113 [Pseudozyma flocculosa PF-1]